MDFHPKFKNLVDVFEASVSLFASRPLFGTKKGEEWVWMNYSTFGELTDAARGGLAALGVKVGDRVAIISNNRPEWAVGAYATYGRGAAYVPMYEAQLDKDWEFILNDSEAKVVIVPDARVRDRVVAFRSALPSLSQVIVLEGGASGPGTIGWDDFLDQGRKNPVPTFRPEPDAVAGFIYTSGTTGNPKGVLLTHSNFASNVSAIHQVFPMSPEDRSLSFLPWAHSFGQTVELHVLLSMGSSMGIAESVNKIVANLAEVRPTLLFSVPRIFNRIYDGLNKTMADSGGVKKMLFEAAMANEGVRRKLASEGRSSGWADFKHGIFDKLVFSKVRGRFGGQLRYAFSGGAAISVEVAEFIDSLGITVYEGYGLTETSPIVTCNRPDGRKIGSIGRAIPGVRVAIDKVATGDDVNGEIVVYGHCVMKGYHALPQENEKVFTADGGFRTGDMGRIDEEGFVYITGRIKEQYKLENGKYVVPTPLEELLKLSPFVTNVMIYGDNRPFNVALVVPDMDVLKKWANENGLNGSDTAALLTDPTVKNAIAEELERRSSKFKQYEKVKDFRLIPDDFTPENDMLTPSLKVKRRVVLKVYGDRIEEMYAR